MFSQDLLISDPQNGVDSEEGSSQMTYSTGDESGESDLEKKERGRSAASFPASPEGVAFPMVHVAVGPGTKRQVGEED